LDFLKFEAFFIGTVRRVNVRAKFHDDWSKRCKHNSHFSLFQDGGCPPSWIWIFKSSKFWPQV